MGFGVKGMKWTKWCIPPPSFSILINGNPIGFFNTSTGIRPRDPLLPYLFVLGMEALLILIDKVVVGVSFLAISS